MQRGVYSSLEESFAYCQEIASSHYENFPVASLFLPRQLRPYVAAIYAFARAADDFADEGDRKQAERLAALQDWQERLDACYDGRADHPIFIALAEVVRRKEIPKQLLADLLVAFTMDVTVHRYETFEELLHYCRHSANPIGRLVLHLFDDASGRNCMLSDDICTALQLTNFWQDVTEDWAKGRLYIPLEDMRRFGYTEHNLTANAASREFRELMQFEIDRTRQMFESGKALLKEATSRLQFELRLTWSGGMAILRKLEKTGCDVFTKRPSITAMDNMSIVLKSFLHRT